MAQLENILKKPLITEKLSVATEKNNVYGFVVELKANKNQIKQAVETLYNVKVLSVNTNVTPGKVKRAGKSLKKTSSYKKAFVQLAEGQTIQFFKGI
jgi:large subunit ribosomal protein L23